MPISEMFTSIQGEGALTGVPSFFVRTSGCNLRCTWCDTPYASWHPEKTMRTIDETIDAARAAFDHNIRHMVLTGGEPMLFDAIEPLCQRVHELGMHITIETAGTIYRSARSLHCDLMSLSPKLSHSTPAKNDPRDQSGVWHDRHEKLRLNIEALTQLISDYPSHQLKFVVRNDEDVTEIDTLLAQLPSVEPCNIMLMPEGVTVPTPESVAWAADLCVQRGWRYCHRLHVELFGNTRGT
ncbi:MAG: 7-carboxy-7-deazaguanine synthase QueE [Phycisphaeraceae bacterium]|nr:7-carboxy-7-deazaguanine synthase QueE [Phycisphaeraceae bacterium]